jgi:hypothetical protein
MELRSWLDAHLGAAAQHAHAADRFARDRSHFDSLWQRAAAAELFRYAAGESSGHLTIPE